MVSAQAGPRQWTNCSVEPVAAELLAQQLGCPLAIAEVLVARGVVEPADAHSFFNPSIDDLIDPMRMLDMDVAVARIQRAVHDGEPILI
jgi:single-stranded-DNA-specific exonuclease